MHDLFEELDAWNPRWREYCRSIYHAATECGVYALQLYDAWIQTEDGRNYERMMFGVPNYAGAVKAAQESAERLPVGVATLRDP